MAALLSLPRELRNLIYEAVLFTPLPSPSSPDNCRTTHYAIREPNAGGNFGYQCVGYAPPQISGSSLLLINHQIRSEVHEIINWNAAANKIVYKLDCIVENVGRLYVTPVLLPVIMSRVGRIEATIRFFGKFELSRGCAALWPYSLVCMLNDFLTKGPWLCYPPENAKTSKIYVDTILIDFLTVPPVPEWMTMRSVLSRPNEVGWKPEGREAGLRMVERELNMILDPPRRMVRSNEILCDQVHWIKSLDDGKIRKEWDMEEIRRHST